MSSDAQTQLYAVLTQDKRQSLLEKRHSFSGSHVMGVKTPTQLRASLSLSHNEMRSIDTMLGHKSTAVAHDEMIHSCHASIDICKVQQNESRTKQHKLHASGHCEHKHNATSPLDSEEEDKSQDMRGTWSKLSHGVEKIKKKLHMQQQEKSAVQIHVEYVECDSEEKLWPYGDEAGGGGPGDVFDDTLDFPDHNYTPSLLIKDISNGLFKAVFPLSALPKGDLTIRIRNYKMEIVVGRRPSNVNNKHRITYPIRYGDIDIPIFVEPSSLDFRFDSEENLIYVCGDMKGCGSGASSGHHRLHVVSPVKHAQHRKLSLPLALSDMNQVLRKPHSLDRMGSSHHSLDESDSPEPHHRIADLKANVLRPIRRIISQTSSHQPIDTRHKSHVQVGDLSKRFRDRAMTH